MQKILVLFVAFLLSSHFLLASLDDPDFPALQLKPHPMAWVLPDEFINRQKATMSPQERDQRESIIAELKVKGMLFDGDDAHDILDAIFSMPPDNTSDFVGFATAGDYPPITIVHRAYVKPAQRIVFLELVETIQRTFPDIWIVDVFNTSVNNVNSDKVEVLRRNLANPKAIERIKRLRMQMRFVTFGRTDELTTERLPSLRELLELTVNELTRVSSFVAKIISSTQAPYIALPSDFSIGEIARFNDSRVNLSQSLAEVLVGNSSIALVGGRDDAAFVKEHSWLEPQDAVSTALQASDIPASYIGGMVMGIKMAIPSIVQWPRRDKIMVMHTILAIELMDRGRFLHLLPRDQHEIRCPDQFEIFMKKWHESQEVRG